MTMEQKIMRNLMRAGGGARRHHRKPEDAHCRRPMGFGHILELLSEEGMSQQQIAETLGIRAQSVSEAISVLESRGYVRRQPSDSDRRKILVCITDEGRQHREEMAQQRAEHAREYFSVLTEEEKTELLRLLEKVNLAAENREKL